MSIAAIIAGVLFGLASLIAAFCAGTEDSRGDGVTSAFVILWIMSQFAALILFFISGRIW